MRIAIILPARLKSMRLPEKLLLARTGKTVLEHTIERAQQALSPKLAWRIIVAADDQRLIAAANRAGAEAMLTDPRHTSGTDRIAEVARKIKEDIVVNLQADEPEMNPRNIRLVTELLIKSDKSGKSNKSGKFDKSGEAAQMATLASPIFDETTWKKPNVVKALVNAAGDAMYFSRAPIPFARDELKDRDCWKIAGKRVYGLHHLGIYAYRREFLLAYSSLPSSKLEQLEKLEQLRALEAGYRIKVGITKSHPPGIDTIEDYNAFVARWKKDKEIK